MKTPKTSKTNLDDLIQKIKSEGVEEAERKSEEIITAARHTASKILDKAALDAEAIAKEAEEEIEDPGAAQSSPADEATGGINLDFKSITAAWSALTHAVSRERMSLATYLQEGTPHALQDNKLIIGFGEEHAFFKETLEANDNLEMVEKIFSDYLGTVILVRYEIVDDINPQIEEADHPAVKDVLDAFGGEITSRWHNK